MNHRIKQINCVWNLILIDWGKFKRCIRKWSFVCCMVNSWLSRVGCCNYVKAVSAVDGGAVTPSLNTLPQFVLVQSQTCHRIPVRWIDSFPKWANDFLMTKERTVLFPRVLGCIFFFLLQQSASAVCCAWRKNSKGFFFSPEVFCVVKQGGECVSSQRVELVQPRLQCTVIDVDEIWSFHTLFRRS